MFTKRWTTRIFLGLLLLLVAGGTAVSHAADSSWSAKYWNNKSLSGDPALARTESNLDHDWGHGAPAGVANDNFSARWKRTINVAAGTYRFTATMDDGMRVWVDDALIIDAWYDSQEHTISADVFLNSGDHQVKVEYYEAGGEAVAKLSYGLIGGTDTGTVPHWRGEYFNNAYLGGSPTFVRSDAAVDFNWGYNSPGSGVGPDNFSVRWTRTLALNGRTRFTVTSDDGVRLWVNNQLLIDNWTQHAAQTVTANVNVAGSVPVKLEYFEAGGLAEVHLTWAPVGQTTPPPGTGGPYTAFVNTAFLNVRQGPGVGYAIITAVPRATAVTLTHRNSDAGWVRVVLPNGTQGWMSARYLASNLKPFTFLPLWQGDDGQSSAPTATVVNCYYLNVRAGPGVGYSVRTIIARNTVVTLAGYRNADASWVKIRLASGVEGWVNSHYLSSTFPFTNLAVGGY